MIDLDHGLVGRLWPRPEKQAQETKSEYILRLPAKCPISLIPVRRNLLRGRRIVMGKDFFRPSVTKIIRCRTCQEIVAFERDFCSLCGIALDHQELAFEAELRAKYIQAVSVANSIISSHAALLFYVISAIELYLYGAVFELREVAIAYEVIIGLIGMIPPYVTFRWISIYGALPGLDREFITKKIVLTVFLYLWGVAHIVNFCMVATHLINRSP